MIIYDFYKMFDDFENNTASSDDDLKAKYNLNDEELKAMFLCLRQRESLLMNLFLCYFNGDGFTLHGYFGDENEND